MADGRNEQSQGNIGDESYNEKFNSSGSSLKNKETSAAKKPDADNEETTLKAKEQGSSSWKTSLGGNDDEKIPLRKRLKGSMRNKGAFSFIIVVIIGGVLYSSVFAPNILLVNMKDLFTNDLADTTTALSKYTVTMLDNKIGKADCGEKDSIKCKLSTMSRNQVLAFKKHGFTVNGEKVEEDNLDDNDPANDKPESRWKVSSVSFPKNGGSASSGEDFAKKASESDDLKQQANSVWNPRSSFYMDVRYKERIKTQFDLTKQPIVSGSNEKEVDESFDNAMKGSEEKIDEGGHGAYSLETLASDEGKDGLKKASEGLAKQAHSYTNAQCGFYTQGKVTYNATKKAKEVSLARFAMIYLIAADQIKAGLSEEIPTNILSSKLAWSSEGGYNGKNATDASMYRHIVLREPVGDIGQTYSADAFDAIGDLSMASIQIMLTSVATRAITGAPGSISQPPTDNPEEAAKYCLDGQTQEDKDQMKPNSCPQLTMAAGAAPQLASLLPKLAEIAAKSDRICPPPGKGEWKMNPTANETSTTVMPEVAKMFNEGVGKWAEKTARNFTSDTKGLDASDALFTGTGIILGDMAMSRGMQPATKDSLKTYLAERKKYDEEYERLARYEAKQKPFDIYNQYTFLGSFVRSFSVPSATDSSIFSAINAVMGIIPASTKKVTTSAGAIYNLQPDELETSRLDCNDKEYRDIGIDADKGCNVRYSFGKKELDAKVKDVLDYMLKEHPDEYKDKIDELKKRLEKTDKAEPEDPEEVQRMIDELEGAKDEPFIDEKTGDATENSEYEKFLTYCVNREDPWGRAAVDVRRKELDDDEKEERRKSKSPDGIQVGQNGKGSEYERPIEEVYVGITEGAKAEQDWRTGKKCMEDSEMLQNFRAYTMMCSVDGSFAGSLDCTETDRAGAYTDSFYTSNDIQYVSWY